MPTGILALAWQAGLLAIGAGLSAFFHADWLYNLFYIAAFLAAGFVLSDNDIGMNGLLFVALFFTIWLFCLPLVTCLVFMASAACGRAPDSTYCSNLLSCTAEVIHHRFGQQIKDMKLLQFFDDGEILEGIINTIPYAFDKLILQLFGVNWVTIVVNLLVIFGFHSLATAISVSMLNNR